MVGSGFDPATPLGKRNCRQCRIPRDWLNPRTNLVVPRTLVGVVVPDAPPISRILAAKSSPVFFAFIAVPKPFATYAIPSKHGWGHSSSEE